MAIYDSEEEQLEALKAWWRENGTSAVVGVVIGIVLISGFNFWQSYKKEKSEQASNRYDQMIKAVSAQKSEEIEALGKQIRDEYGNSRYAGYAGLQLAKIKVDKNDLPGAMAILREVMGQSNKELSHVARIRLIRLLLATKEYEQGLQLINEVNPASESAFAASYDELAGDLYVALERIDEARTAYQSALNGGNHSPLLQMKIDDLTVAEPLPLTAPKTDGK